MIAFDFCHDLFPSFGSGYFFQFLVPELNHVSGLACSNSRHLDTLVAFAFAFRALRTEALADSPGLLAS